MANPTLAAAFLAELDAEAVSTRKCIERFKEELYDWKPHEKSMPMGYLTLMLADLPNWIAVMLKDGVIDLATWPRFDQKSTEALLQHFDENLAAARAAVQAISDDALEQETFTLKMGEQELMKTSKLESLSSTLNHWVHHRGQMTVYMRLNDIPVPSVYGPSADDQTF